MLHGPVLVGTDLSAGAEEALRQAQRLAADLGTALLVCHVLPEFLRVGMLFPQWRGIDPALQRSMTTKAEHAVRRQLEAVLAGEGAAARIVLDSGTPHAGLLEQAQAAGAGVVVTGTGEVASEVVRHASVPVLVARRSPHGVVMAATDFSDASVAAVETGAFEARRRKSSFHLVHVLDVSPFVLGHAPAPARPYLDGASAIALEGLDELSALAQSRLDDYLKSSRLQGTATVSSGHPADAIARLAETAGAELVVVGTHGRSGLARLTLGSTASAVIDAAPCSVLVVRQAP